MTLIVQVYRPELFPEFDGRTEAYEYMTTHPFEAIETLGIVADDKEANALIDKFQPGHPDWHFHIEPILFPLRVV